MATEVGTAYLTILPSARGFGSSLQRQVGGSVASTGTAMGKESSKRYKSAFLGGLKGMATGIGAFLALDKTVQFFSGAIEEAREAEKVGSRTANVIKSTGGAAKVTAKEVANLAEALSNKVGQDDEAIQSGANLLLTFKNIRDEAGKGNDIFDQTTGLMVDMSTAMGQDMKSSAIQLGKALNDPTKGISALSRVGVTFSAGQEKQIKHLQKTGDLMGAQKVILKELKSEFGGAGKAMADPAAKAQVAWGNLKEDVGTALMPTLNKLANWFTDTGLPGIRKFAKKYGPDIKEFGSDLWDAAKDMGPAIKTTLPILADVIGDVGKAFGGFARAFSSLPKPLQTAIVTAALTGYGIRKLGGASMLPSLAAPVAATAATTTVATAGTAATAGVGATAARKTIGSRVAKFVWPVVAADILASSLKQTAWGKNTGIDSHSAVANQFRGIQNVQDALDGISDTLKVQDRSNFFGVLSDYDELDAKLSGLLKSNPGKGMKLLQAAAKAAGVPIRQLTKDLPDTADALDGTKVKAFEQAKGLRAARKEGWDLLGLWRKNLVPTAKTLADRFGLDTDQAGKLRKMLADTTGTAKQHEKQLREVARQMGLNKQQTQELINKYGDIPKRVETRAAFLTAEAARARDKFLTDTKGKFSDLGNETYAIMVNGQSGHGRLPSSGAAGFAYGGYVSGPGGPRADRIHARLSDGEFVVNADATRKNRELLESINSKRFADGGYVGRTNTKVHADFSALRGMVSALVKSLKAAGGSVPATMAWVKRQVGDPYLMGGTGPNAWDCSGFMSGITHHLLGQSPYGPRLFATSTFPTSMFARGDGTFMIGSTRDAGGGIGHMAGTLGGVNVESSGGVGVHIGSGARGAHDPLFGGNVWHLKQGLIKQVIAGGRGDPAGGDMHGRSASAARAYAQSLARSRYGWGRQQFSALNSLWNQESGWRWDAANPSGAYGIPQSLPGSKMAAAGADWFTNPATQIQWGLNYIKGRYHTPKGAMAHEISHGWYDQGGVLKPGFTMAYNGTGRDEYVSKEPPRRHRGPIRIELDIGGRRTLTGVIRDEVNGELDFESTTGRMR